MSAQEQYNWWAALKHGGMLIAPAKLADYFDDTPPPLSPYLADRLRRDVTRLLEADGGQANEQLNALLDTVLEALLGLDRAAWRKGPQVDSDWSQQLITRETVKPRRLWLGPHGAVLALFLDDSGTRLGIGRSRRTVSRVVEWLRRANQRLALLTNGRQWRLIHAGADYEAWCEWEIDFWFEEGQPSRQITALRQLLGAAALTPPGPDTTSPILAAIQASRQGQAELSTVLGERVRQAVELLIKESAPAIANLRMDPDGAELANNALYIAACRVIMRCVIVLFAEARDLLRRDNAIYHDSYGIQGLREQLDRLAGGRAQEQLRHSYSAWPRLLALFDLVYRGSAHKDLPIPAYRGELFAPGDSGATDAVRRAMVAFESVEHCPSDAAVHRILELLTRSKVKVRQGRSSTWVDAPVDFSDLSSEYIGILYQGLLDFELRQAGDDEPLAFLNLGDQPVLPLARLEAMVDDALAALVEKLKGSKQADAAGDEEEAATDEEDTDAEEEESDEGDEAEANAEAESTASEEDPFADDVSRQVRTRAVAWAQRAVVAGKLVKAPRGKSADALAQYDAEVAKLAEQLIARIVLPGEWFLVRWGGTRKGAGTFYTRPQLGVPLVRRTLQPLAYEPSGEDAERWVPKMPETILGLKICDSAMGSGSLLVAALRYLTNALYESLLYHGRVTEHNGQTLVRLSGGGTTNSLLAETLPLPVDHPDLEEQLKARLKRYVVERSIYGVDLDPLAVELAKLSLWIETMDRALPFGFLDHKLKCGNALVGCWFDRFQDYPVLAWEREGGDKNHDRFVHHYYEQVATRGTHKGKVERRGDKWTQAIKDLRNDRIKPQMVEWISAQHAPPFAFAAEGYSAPVLHDEALAVFAEMAALPVHATEEKARLYRAKIVDNPAIAQLKLALDTWCAIWFWPGDQLELAPTPKNFAQPPAETAALVTAIAERQHFFHWELEFPDVFATQRAGFDAMLGNPPWDILKPKSQEFFSNIDPLYRTYGKQEANAHQTALFAQQPTIERDWLEYNAQFKAFSNWNKHVSTPFGDEEMGGAKFSFSRAVRETNALHNTWRNRRRQRSGYADNEHPFLHQGSADINTYKMFLELNYSLAREGGRLGMIVPSGLYTDNGTAALRELFLNHCRWEWLFGFINWNKIFDAVYYRFKFCLTIAEKGGETAYVNSVFSRYHLQEWEEAERYVIPFPRAQVEQFSPRSKALLETRTQRDLEILTKIYRNSVTLGDDGPGGWDLTYTREFDMTGDSKLFPPLPTWERKGYQPDEYGNWLRGNWQPYAGEHSVLDRPPGLILSRDGTQAIAAAAVEEIALPLYEGRMVGQFDFSQKGWVSGKGRTAVWRDVPWAEKVIEPQFLMGLQTQRNSSPSLHELKLVIMDVTSSTNSRATIATVLNPWPGGHKTPRLVPQNYSLVSVLASAATLNSFAFDFIIRSRLGGQSLTWAILAETALSKPIYTLESCLATIAARLSLISTTYARSWLKIRDLWTSHQHWQHLWAVTTHERYRLRAQLDAILAHLYNLSEEDLFWILHNCDHPVSQMRDKAFYRTLDPKGFWRVDKDRDPELRHTVLSLIAFHDLKTKGIDAFLAQNHGAGWLIPETLRLADYGLGHDDRAQEAQPVAARLGPRFLPWQLAGTPAASWAECERHAENLRLLLGDINKTEELTNGNENQITNEEPVQWSLLVD